MNGTTVLRLTHVRVDREDGGTFAVRTSFLGNGIGPSVLHAIREDPGAPTAGLSEPAAMDLAERVDDWIDGQEGRQKPKRRGR